MNKNGRARREFLKSTNFLIFALDMRQQYVIFIFSLLAWGSLLAHDYVPHHHHNSCLESHESHQAHHQSTIADQDETHDDASCFLNSFFDKSSAQKAIFSSKITMQVKHDEVANKIFCPYVFRGEKKPDIKTYSLRGPPKILS